MDVALVEGFPLSPEPDRMDPIKIGDSTAYARKVTQVIPGLTAWLPGQTEVLVYGVEAVEDLRAALHISSVIGEPLMYRSKEAPGPFSFEIPDAKVEYSHGVWHIRRGARVARATWFGGYSLGAPWYMSSGTVGAGSHVEWDVIGHVGPMHPLYEQKHNHVNMVAAYVTLLEHLEVPMADADIGFALPYGGQAMRLASDGSVLVFHPKRGAAWRILDGETFALGTESAPWAKCSPLTADVVALAWGDTGVRPAAPAPRPAWEVADSKNPGAPIKLPTTSAKELVVVVRLDGEDVVVSEDGDVDYEMFDSVEDWTIYTAA